MWQNLWIVFIAWRRRVACLKNGTWAPVSQKSLKNIIIPLWDNNYCLFSVLKDNYVVCMCCHFLRQLLTWNENVKFILLCSEKNSHILLFLAPARPKTKPIPIHDATGKLLVTSTTITIRMPICYYNDDHGPIKNVQVLVAETGGSSGSVCLGRLGNVNF